MKRIYFLIWLAFFSQPIFFNRFMYSTADLLNENFSVWTFIGDSLRQGVFPLFDTYYLGSSFFTVAWTALLYPLTIPLAYIGSFLSLDNRMYLLEITSLFHVFIASLTMDYLLKTIGLSKLGRLFGSITFAYCSFVIIATTSLTHIQSICWLPLLIAFFLQKRVIGGSISLALMILGGHPTEAVYTLQILIVWGLFSKRVTHSLMIGFGGLLLASLQVVPTLWHYFYSVRNNASFQDLTTIGSVPPFYFLTLFIPHLFGGTGGYIEWGYFLGIVRSSVMFCYMGILPIALFITAIFRKESRSWIILAFISIFMAMGKYSFLYHLLWKTQFRNPASWLIFFCLSVAVVSALAYDKIFNNHTPINRPVAG